MITTGEILQVSCPLCGAGPSVPCTDGHPGNVRAMHHPRRTKHAIDERAFWLFIDEQLADPGNSGKSEQDLLDRIAQPGWTGRRARTHAQAREMVPLPAQIRDFRRAAAGDDSDEAA